MLTVFVDPQRCIGCLQCEFACAVEHSHSRDPVAALHELPVPRKRVHVQAGPNPNTAFPNKCRHCDPAPCLQVCPTGAIYRDAAHDAVLIDTGKCIACAMCAMVCPFDVITYHAYEDGGRRPRTVAVKCDGCIDRRAPARSRPVSRSARSGRSRFGDVNDLVAADQRRETAAVFAAWRSTEPEPSHDRHDRGVAGHSGRPLATLEVRDDRARP